MYYSAYIGNEDRHLIKTNLEVVSAGHIIMDGGLGDSTHTLRPQGFPDYQIIYIRRGAGIFFLDGVERRIEAGNAVLYRPHERQEYVYRENDRAEVYWVHFGGYDTEGILRQLGLNEGTVIPLNSEGELARISAELIKELQLQSDDFRMSCRGLLISLLVQLKRNSKKNTDARIEKVRAKLTVDYAEEITNEQLAEMCGMSVSGFAHQFKKEIGVSPREYILQQRLSAALFLLENTDGTISDISRRVGFEDNLYFSKFFRSRIGISPSDYRNYTLNQGENK